MIKRINQYLITNHPQIWNTKLVWVMASIILTHICFYVAGFAHFDDFSKLHSYYHIDNQMVQSINIGFSVLATFLTLTIWLVFYLRNNPFKSFYPLKPLYFITEFGIIILVVFSSMMFYKSYAEGFCQAIRIKTAETNMVEEINTLNLAYGLIPQDKRFYKLHASCDSLDYINGLKALNDKYEYLSADNLPKTVEERADEIPDQDAVTDVVDTVKEAINDFYRREKADANLSLLHFCQKFFNHKPYDTLTLSKYQIAAQMQQWLTTGNKEEVKKVLTRFDAMCRKYKIDYNIAITDYADYAFADTNFRPSHYVSYHVVTVDDASFSTAEDQNPNNWRLEMGDVERSLENIQNANETKDDEWQFLLLNLFIAFNLSILLFTFRLTPVRVWFTAVAGHFGLPIITGLLAVMVNSETGNYVLILLIAYIAYLLHFAFRKTMKKTSGVFLIWFTWWQLYIGLIVYSLLEEVYRPHEVLGPDGKFHMTPSPFYDFLQHYDAHIAAGYMLFTFLFIGLVLSRNYRKWMALPEE